MSEKVSEFLPWAIMALCIVAWGICVAIKFARAPKPEPKHVVGEFVADGDAADESASAQGEESAKAKKKSEKIDVTNLAPNYMTEFMFMGFCLGSGVGDMIGEIRMGQAVGMAAGLILGAFVKKKK